MRYPENAARQNVNLLRTLENDDYSRYLDSLAQYNTDRSFGYGALRDALGDARADDLTQYQRYLDERENDRYTDETAYNRARAALEDAATVAQLGGQIGDFSGYERLGFTPDAEALLRMTLADNGRTVPVGSGGTGGRGGGKQPEDENEMDYEGLFQAARESGNPRSWLSQKSNYSRYGFTSSSGLWADYQNWAEGGGGDPAENQRNSAANPEALEYSPDEGVFTWNGKKYSSANAFRSAVQSKYLSGGISREQARKILDAANAYGFRF